MCNDDGPCIKGRRNKNEPSGRSKKKCPESSVWSGRVSFTTAWSFNGLRITFISVVFAALAAPVRQRQKKLVSVKNPYGIADPDWIVCASHTNDTNFTFFLFLCARVCVCARLLFTWEKRVFGHTIAVAFVIDTPPPFFSNHLRSLEWATLPSEVKFARKRASVDGIV